MYSLVQIEEGIILIKNDIKLELTEGEVNLLLNELSLFKNQLNDNLYEVVGHSSNTLKTKARRLIEKTEKEIESKQRFVNTLKNFLNNQDRSTEDE